MLRLFFFLFIGQFLFAQVHWFASGEAGYYNSSGKLLQFEEEILARLNLKGGYSYKSEKNIGKFDCQLLPEIYGFENKLQTTKIGIDGFYSHLGKEFDSTIRIAAYQYFFSDEIADFSYDSFLLNGQLVWPFKPQFSIDARAGIAYRNFNQRNAVSLDIIFSEIDLVFSYNSFTKLTSGLYLEKFELKKRIDFYFESANAKNNGTRIGPIVRLNHTKNFVLNIDYQFLLHDSEYTSYPSYDHWLRIIAGKNIIKNLSAFILVDYYQRKFAYQKDENFTELLYSPINFENRIYFKLSNTIKSNQKVFLKIGYFDEKLFYRDYSLSGWKAYIGFEIKG
jgi:hypothetical protein